MVKAVWRWFAHRPFTSGLIVSTCLVTPAYIRQAYDIDANRRASADAQDAADDADAAAAQAQATANALAALVVQIEKDNAAHRHELCERDVADQVQIRAMWLFVLEELLDPADQSVAAARKGLDVIHPLLECNADDVAVPIEPS